MSMADTTTTSTSCQMSEMLWNWNTINTCLLSKSWHITSNGGFTGSCIGIFFVAVGLELVRRIQREFDRYIVRKYRVLMRASPAFESPNSAGSVPPWSAMASSNNSPLTPTALMSLFVHPGIATPTGYVPSTVEQSIRAALYLAQFAGAYLIMLMAMSFNGYVIVCILAGAFVGHFWFAADSFVDMAAGAGNGSGPVMEVEGVLGDENEKSGVAVTCR